MGLMIEVVIIGHNEGEYVERMIESLPQDWKKIYVADRCTDGTIDDILKKYPEILIIDTTPLSLQGRQISFVKNLGISYTSEDSDVLVIDGDRYIVNGDIESVYKEMKTDITILTLEKDGRNHPKFDFSKTYGKIKTGFLGAGIIFRREALNKIKAHPLMKGQVFPEALQIYWGIEDTGLGDVCYDLGLTVELRKDINLRGEFSKKNFDSSIDIVPRLQFRTELKKTYYGRIRSILSKKRAIYYFIILIRGYD